MTTHGELLRQLPRMVAALSANDPATLLDVVTHLRKLLSLEVNPPIAEVIAAGVVPRLVQFLAHHQQPALQFEAAWALTNIASGASEQAQVVIEMGAVPLFVQLMRSPVEDLREQAAWALGNLAGDSPQFRDFVLHQGAMQALMEAVVETSRLSLLRNATWAISNLCRGKPAPPYDLVSPVLPVLARLLYSTDDEVQADACWALSYLSDGPNDRIQAVIEAGVCRRLLELLMSNSFSVQTPALRIIGNIVTGDDHQTQVVLNSSGLVMLQPLLDSPKKGIRKEACWTLSNITAGSPAHIQAVIEQGGIFPRLVALLVSDQSDLEVKVQAAWAVSNATSRGTPEQIRYLVEQAGCLRSLCALLDYNNDKIAPIVLEALFNIASCTGAQGAGESGCNRYAVYIKDLGALDKVVQLQTHSDDDIRDKAVRLLRCICGNAGGGDADVDMDSETSPAAAAGGASSNVFSFGTFRAALP